MHICSSIRENTFTCKIIPSFYRHILRVILHRILHPWLMNFNSLQIHLEHVSDFSVIKYIMAKLVEGVQRFPREDSRERFIESVAHGCEIQRLHSIQIRRWHQLFKSGISRIPTILQLQSNVWIFISGRLRESEPF